MSENKEKQQKKNTNKPVLKIADADVKPLLVGLTMLVISGIIGYTLGFRSAEGVLENSSQADSVLRPTASLTQEPDKPENVILSIPPSWNTYNSFFGTAQFSFRYPPGYTVSDTDVRSGQLYIFPEDEFTFPAPVVIDSLGRTFFFQQYESGLVEDWFIENLEVVYPNTDFSDIMIENVTDPQGKTYLKVSNWPETIQQINENLFTGVWYVQANSTNSYYLIDNNILPDETIQQILASLEVSTP